MSAWVGSKAPLTFAAGALLPERRGIGLFHKLPVKLGSRSPRKLHLQIPEGASLIKRFSCSQMSSSIPSPSSKTKSSGAPLNNSSTSRKRSWLFSVSCIKHPFQAPRSLLSGINIASKPRLWKAKTLSVSVSAPKAASTVLVQRCDRLGERSRGKVLRERLEALSRVYMPPQL